MRSEGRGHPWPVASVPAPLIQFGRSVSWFRSLSARKPLPRGRDSARRLMNWGTTIAR
jgi:hypothetical protein